MFIYIHTYTDTHKDAEMEKNNTHFKSKGFEKPP